MMKCPICGQEMKREDKTLVFEDLGYMEIHITRYKCPKCTTHEYIDVYLPPKFPKKPPKRSVET